MRLQVRSLALLSELRIRLCRGLWYSRKPPYAIGAALEKAKRQKKKKSDGKVNGKDQRGTFERSYSAKYLTETAGSHGDYRQFGSWFFKKWKKSKYVILAKILGRQLYSPLYHQWSKNSFKGNLKPRQSQIINLQRPKSKIWVAWRTCFK